MNKYAELLLEAALAGQIKKADLDPMILWGLLGGAAGAGTSALKTMTGDQPQAGAGSRALRAGLMGAGLGAAGAGSLKMLGVNPKLPKLIAPEAKGKTPVSSSVGVGLLGAGAVGGAGALDRARAKNRTLSANADILSGAAPPNAGLTKVLEEHGTALPRRVISQEPSLARLLAGFNQSGHELESTLKQHHSAHLGLGNTGKALNTEKLLQALKTKGNVAKPGMLGKMPLKSILGAGGAVGLVHYLLNRKKQQ